MVEEKQDKVEKLKKRLYFAMAFFALLAPLIFDLMIPRKSMNYPQTHMFNGGIIGCVVLIAYFKGSRILNWLYFLLWWTLWSMIGTTLMCLVRGYTIDMIDLAIGTIASIVPLFVAGLVIGGFFWAFSDE